jgi:transcriptional regulator with GAF, ATPase, and Fis domain
MNAARVVRSADPVDVGQARHAGGYVDSARPVLSADPLGQLLAVILEGSEIRDVCTRASEIAHQILPHDNLELTVYDRSGNVTLHMQSDETDPLQRSASADTHGLGIVEDLRLTDSHGLSPEQRVRVEQMLAAGYRSYLEVRADAGAQTIGLCLFSKDAGAFAEADLARARQMAAYLGVAVSHQQLLHTERARVEANLCVEQAAPRPRVLPTASDRSKPGSDVIGESAGWRSALRHAFQVAATDTTVFLQGESGTGKEVLARFIHQASPRSRGPFVAINCAALPEQLLESELFGYERGAFTGAVQPKPGQIEMAAKGVLFLDEVTEMSPAAQAKFLRFLQEREFQRVGGTRVTKANVRVIAASNRNLREAVDNGAFREDLYYRLQVFDIRLPPLRERLDDIPLLADAFLRRLSESSGLPRVAMTPEAMHTLCAHSWPGNVRELQNALERALILCEHGVIKPSHLSLHDGVARVERGSDLGVLERQKIEQVLRETDWNKAKAARRLGLSRTQLYVRLRKHGLPAVRPLNLV